MIKLNNVIKALKDLEKAIKNQDIVKTVKITITLEKPKSEKR
jgi:hypothetical protein